MDRLQVVQNAAARLLTKFYLFIYRRCFQAAVMCPVCLSKKHSVPSIVNTSKPSLIPLQISGVCVKMTQANLRNPLKQVF